MVNGEWLKWIVRLAVVAWAGFITVEALASRDFRNHGDSFTREDAARIEGRLNTLENGSTTLNSRMADTRQDLSALRTDIGDFRKEVISGIKDLKARERIGAP